MRIIVSLTILGLIWLNNKITCIYAWSGENDLTLTRPWTVQEEDIIVDSYLEELREILDKYKNYEKAEHRHLAKKRNGLNNNGGIYRPLGHYEWLRRNPKSVLIGSVAAITLFLGLVLTIGIVVRRRYLLNSMSKSGSLIGQEAGDKKLAHSAQMYHYQFQKQQILAMEKASIKNDQSEDEGTDVETDGDFTVYECSGIPKVNEVEVKNPLFTGKEQSDDGGNADDDLINTSQNSDTFVEEKNK